MTANKARLYDLILSRGHYCPKDFQQHRLLVELYPEIAVAYTRIVTISTDTILEANEMRQSLGAQWLFLTDPAPPGPARPRHRRVHRPAPQTR